MPNIKSAEKRVAVSQKKAKENKMILSAVRTSIKKVKLEVAAGNKEQAAAMLPGVFAEIDSACSKGILHRNNAANKKARLSKSIDSIKNA